MNLRERPGGHGGEKVKDAAPPRSTPVGRWAQIGLEMEVAVVDDVAHEQAVRGRHDSLLPLFELGKRTQCAREYEGSAGFVLDAVERHDAVALHAARDRMRFDGGRRETG